MDIVPSHATSEATRLDGGAEALPRGLGTTPPSHRRVRGLARTPDKGGARGEAEMEQQILPLLGRPETEQVVEVGGPAVVLSEQARYWQADLLVVARHDRGTLDRLVLGSVTERLLDGLPTSILVVPAIGARGKGQQRTAPLPVGATPE